MKATTKIRRSIRAISPVISVLLMIAIAVAASLVAYAWIMGYMGGTTTKVGKAVLIQSMAPAEDGNLLVYVQNVGQGSVTINSVYVDDVLRSFTPDPNFADNKLPEGKTASLEVDYLVPDSGQVKVKVVTTEGTFTESSAIRSGQGSSGNLNIIPTAAFSFSSTDPEVGETVTFTDASTDSDGSVVSWSWTFGDGGTSTAQNPTHSYASANTYTVRLTVTDDDGATNYVEHDVPVAAANVAPTAAFSFSPTDPEVGETVTFTDASTDSDGTVVAWAWAFGDGGTSTLQNPTHSYASANTYTVRLTVTDDDGATNYVENDVTVTSAPVTVTLLSDGFEEKWDSSTDWDRQNDQAHGGTYSINSDNSNEGSLYSYSINAQGASSITVTFWYRHTSINDDEFELYFYDNGDDWNRIARLGNAGGDNGWYSYTTSTTDSQYRHSNFRILFYTDSLGSGNNVWVDDVQVTVTGGPGTTFADDFELPDVEWDANWNAVSSNWDPSTTEHSGSLSATSDNDGSFTCNNLDASHAVSITVDFWLRLDDTEDDNLILYFYDGSNYDPIANLGAYGTYGNWLHYTYTTTDSQYFKSNFRIQLVSNLGSGENVWIDDVLITAQVIP